MNRRMHGWSLLLALVCGCSEVAQNQRAMVDEKNSAAVADRAFEQLVEGLPKYGDDFVFEWDIAMSRDDLRHYVDSGRKWRRIPMLRPTTRRISAEFESLYPPALRNGDDLLMMLAEKDEKVSRFEPRLLVDITKSRWNIWSWNQRKLTYAVDRNSFSEHGLNADRVVQEIQKAASDWVSACSACGITIDLHDDLGLTPNDKLTFVVRYDSSPKFLALAFFPGDPFEKRFLRIMPSWFEAEQISTGIIRHEIGHILGYRHEYADVPNACSREADGWRRLTQYDNRSVMHFFCGLGTRDMSLSELDKKGHHILYSWHWNAPELTTRQP